MLLVRNATKWGRQTMALSRRNNRENTKRVCRKPTGKMRKKALKNVVQDDVESK